MTLTTNKINPRMRKPQIVERGNLYADRRRTISGNNICRKCGGCCTPWKWAWAEYYYDMFIDGKDRERADGLAEKYPWFRKLWEQYLKDRTTYNRIGGSCMMLDKKKDLYSCKIHRICGFEAKPEVCKEHRCSKLAGEM